MTLTMNPAVDGSCEAESVFPERKLRCGPPTYEAGGGGVNVSRAILKLSGNSIANLLAGGLSGQKIGDGVRDGPANQTSNPARESVTSSGRETGSTSARFPSGVSVTGSCQRFVSGRSCSTW